MNRRLAFLLCAAIYLFFTTVSAYSVVGEIVGFVLDRRQDERNSTSSTSTTSSSVQETSVSSSSTTTISTTSEETTTVTRSTSESSTIPPSSTSVRPTSTAPPDETSTSETQETSTRLTTKTTVIVTDIRTITFSESGSYVVSTLYTSSTQTLVVTPTPSGNDDNRGGISASTRNTIIGVVVGVGGSIIIGALAIVAYRLRRKKSVGFNDDSAASPSSTNPLRQDTFKATLDQYHKPPGTVNPSANF